MNICSTNINCTLRGIFPCIYDNRVLIITINDNNDNNNDKNNNNNNNNNNFIRTHSTYHDNGVSKCINN